MKIAVLVSGGVDSSVALRLLQEAGERDLKAFYLKIWLEDELAGLGSCPWEDDLRHVRAVCEGAGVPIEIVSLQAEYHARVVDVAIRELRAGRTPSPDIFCNSRIKYGAFLERIGPDFGCVATGHYARMDVRDGRPLLLRAVDPVKDQTYFLSHLTASQVARARFPIGHLHKAGVRALARQFGLPNADRPDSQGICFLGKIRYPDFVRFHLGEQPGAILEAETGRELGTHNGFWFFTVGQRQGLRLGGGPWYVVKRDPVHNTIVVAHADRLPAFARNRFFIGDVNWIHAPPGDGAALTVRVRHGPALTPCRCTGRDRGQWEIEMADADPGIAPGQCAVLYEGEVCLGGGTILDIP